MRARLKSVGDGIDQAVGDFKATALFGDVIPDIVQSAKPSRRAGFTV